MPVSVAVRLSLAEIRRHRHWLRVEQGALELLVPMGVEPADTLDLGQPSHADALRLARAALRPEEVAMLRATRADAEAAVRMAPWFPQARILRGGAAVALGAAAPAGAQKTAAGLADLDLAVRLAPNDAGVLADAAAALAPSIPALRPQAEGKTAEARVLDWGRRALELDPSLSDAVLAAWWEAGIPLTRALDLPGLPPGLLWRLDAQARRLASPDLRRRSLEAIRRSLADPVPPPGSAYWSDRLRAAWSRDMDRHRLRWTQEAMRHHLASGDGRALDALREARKEARRIRMEIELERGSGPGRLSDAMLRLRRRDLARRGWFDAPQTVAWARDELAAGVSAADIDDAVAEAWLGASAPPDNLPDLLARPTDLRSTPMLAGLAEAWRFERARSPAEAADRLERLLAEGTVPPRFHPRVGLWLARLHEAAGRPERRNAVLFAAAETDPRHPDLLAALAEAGLAPPPESDVPGGLDLDLTYLGGRLILTRLEILGHDADEESPSIRLVWRYGGRLPADLELVVQVRNRQDALVFQRQTVLAEHDDARFQSGHPVLGAAWTRVHEIPATLIEDHVLRIHLRSASRPVPTDEGLAWIDVPLRALTGPNGSGPFGRR